ncbi:methyl-accepting chemotaxis protein [Bacillus sp. FJAT-45350]|uniref:methyl-accepting chemotaxis protein n=1 Tax=Bacillus sp. FJAT-45350 TaxID=2011014 RepID=UPI00359C699D
MLIIFSSLIVLFALLFTYFYIVSMNNAHTNLENQAVGMAEQLSDESTFIQIHTNKIQLTGIRDELDGAVHVQLGQVGVPDLLRNPDHEPDAFEMKALEEFQANPELTSYQQLVEVNGQQVYRYLEPLRISDSCIGCHGGAKGELDPLGHVREGLNVGDLKGAVTVTVPATHVINGVKENTSSLVIGGLIIILLLLVIIFITIRKTIVSPVQSIVSRVQKISNGDLTDNDIEIRSKDEIGELAQAADQMKKQLRQLIHKMKESSEQVTAASQQLTSNSGETSAASEEISSFIEQIASSAKDQSSRTNTLTTTIEDVTKHFGQVADKTTKVKNMSQETEIEATKGKDAVQSTVNQIHVIRDTVQDLSKVIEQLSERSKAINSIISVISDISAQTNLLALNAAIEASRAGEQGKGFAVVAEEVRKLAEQSASSAKNVTELIQKIQTDTSKVVSKMKYGLEEVEKGEHIATTAGESFQQILESITSTVREIEAVTAGTEQIAENTVQIFTGIDEVRTLAQEVADGSSEASDKVERQDEAIQSINESSKQLARLSEELLSSIQNFKV